MAVSFAVFLLVTKVLFPFNRPLDLDKLAPSDAGFVDSILQKLEPVVKAKEADGTLPVLSFQEFSGPLHDKEMLFLEKIRTLKPADVGVKTPFLGFKPVPGNLVRIEGQPVTRKSGQVIGPQYLPRPVHEAYDRMMAAMQAELGRRLYVDSGYRSPDCQLYNFLFYLKKRNYNVRDTAKWNALPGYSEHGNPETQAVDFISTSGADGDQPPEEFEALAEYQWLLKSAAKFGFELSYSRHNPAGIGFEPWHWRYCGDRCALDAGHKVTAHPN